MDRARDAVLDLDEELREHVLLVEGRVADITLGRSVDDVADGEALDRLVLSSARTVSASFL